MNCDRMLQEVPGVFTRKVLMHPISMTAGVEVLALINTEILEWVSLLSMIILKNLFYPTLRYTGRYETDPLGIMTFEEEYYCRKYSPQ